MTLSFIRCFLIIGSAAIGYYVGMILEQPLLGAEIGALSGLILIFVESRLKRVSVRGLSSMVFGLILGVILAKLLSDIMALLPLGEIYLSISRVVLTLIFAYLGAVMALRGKDEFNLIIPYVQFRRQDVMADIVLVDTSAIIDGRISDVYKTRFFTGRLVVPRFVLQELQQLADSEDELKRQKGKRGIDLLHQMQEDPKIDITTHEDEMPGNDSVDNKLVLLARMMDARVCTTDYNLSRVASLQKIEVLNVNELAEALKPVAFVGEMLTVKLVKEGKEPEQAVGYMADGTMVVVANGKKMLGQESQVTVTSVLQTASGKMVFARINN